MFTQSAMSHLAPTIAVTFVLGVAWPRANSFGALLGMAAGFTIGIARFVISYVYK